MIYDMLNTDYFYPKADIVQKKETPYNLRGVKPMTNGRKNK